MWSHAYLRKTQFISAELFISPIISFMWGYKHTSIIIKQTFWFTYMWVFSGAHEHTPLVLLGRWILVLLGVHPWFCWAEITFWTHLCWEAEMSLKSITWDSSMPMFNYIYDCSFLLCDCWSVDNLFLSPYSCGGGWLSTSSPSRGWGGRRMGKSMCWGCP